MSGIKTMDLGGNGALREVETKKVLTPDMYRAILYKATLAAREYASEEAGISITLRTSLAVANRWALNNGFKAGYAPLADELFISMVGEATPALDRYLKNNGLTEDEVQVLLNRSVTPITSAIVQHHLSITEGTEQHA